MKGSQHRVGAPEKEQKAKPDSYAFLFRSILICLILFCTLSILCRILLNFQPCTLCFIK